MKYTTKQLKKETCRSFGGNNCVLHGCMFGCELEKARARAKGKEPQKEVVVNCGPLDKLRRRKPHEQLQ